MYKRQLSDLINKAGGATNYAYLRGAKLTRVANASEKKRMGDVIRLMSRQDVYKRQRVHFAS